MFATDTARHAARSQHITGERPKLLPRCNRIFRWCARIHMDLSETGERYVKESKLKCDTAAMFQSSATTSSSHRVVQFGYQNYAFYGKGRSAECKFCGIRVTVLT